MWSKLPQVGWPSGRFLPYALLICSAALVGTILPQFDVTYQLVAIFSLGIGIAFFSFLLIRGNQGKLSGLDSRRAVLLTVLITVPIIKWSGPGNTAIPDLFMALVIVYAISVAFRRRYLALPQKPLLIAYLGILVAGLFATALSPIPSRSVLTLVQEIYLGLVWIAVFNLLRRERRGTGDLIIWAAKTWVIIASAVAALVVIGATNALPTISQNLVFLQSRGTGFFRDPNMAAHYLAISLFVIPLAYTGRQHSRLSTMIYLAIAIVVLAGVIFTKSNGIRVALAASLATIFMGSLLTIRNRKKYLVLAIAIIAFALGTLLAVTASQKLANTLETVNESSIAESFRISAFNYTLERRVISWSTAFQAFRLSPWGVGPGVLGKYADNELLGYNEAHNDFLSVLSERGWLGMLAFLSFVAILMANQVRTITDVNKARRPNFSILTLSRLGMVVCMTVMAFSVDTLHFRHLWLAIPLFLSDRRF